MNDYKAIQVEYLRPDQTIETIQLTDKENTQTSKLVYVYNYGHTHFRVFGKIIELSRFLSGKDDYKLLAEYLSDRGLDNFLGNLKIAAST